MGPDARQQPRPPRAAADESEQSPPSGEAVVVRNYDSSVEHHVTVRLLDRNDELVVSRTKPVPPQSVVSLSAELDRGVYRVHVRVDDERLTTAECVVGSGPTETALVELGNGVVSVVDGII